MRSLKEKLFSFYAPSYDYKSGLYKIKDGRFLPYREALKHTWRCDKCLETFSGYGLLKEHRKESHSY